MAVESFGDFYALPEDCIANALSLTSPKDASRLSLVASTFRSAAQSDAVWERFLPSDYRQIISRCIDAPDFIARFKSKKDLFLYLCDHPILIDSGLKCFSLEKWSGKKCFMLSARDLFIVWSDTPNYWQWITHPKSRFPEVAELLHVCWFEIRGKISINMLSPATNYAAYLVFTCNSRTHGFDHQPAEACVGVSGHEAEKRTICLDPDGAQRERFQIVPRRIGLLYHRLPHLRRQQQENMPVEQNTHYPKPINDEWMEVELGEFFVNEGQDGDLEVSLMEVKGGNWKSGIIIQGIEIRPKLE